MESAKSPIDLCLYYPETNLTRQLEHYANLISGLFEHGFVLLLLRSESHCFYLASDPNHPKWVSWFLARPEDVDDYGFSQFSFFLPGYHCCCQTTPLGDSATRMTLLLIRHTNIDLTDLQLQAFDMLAHAVMKTVSDTELLQLQQRTHLKTRWPFQHAQSYRGQAMLQWQDGVMHLTATTDIFTATQSAFFSEEPLQNWLKHHLLQQHPAELSNVRLCQFPHICELTLWRLAPDQGLLTLTDFTAEYQLKHLQQQDRVLQGLFDCNLAGMIGLNAHSELVFANTSARELLWLPLQVHPFDRFNLYHLAIYQLGQNDSLTRVDPAGFLQTLTQNELMRYRLDFPDGSHKVIDCRGRMQQKIENPDVLAYCMLLDVSEQYQLQQVLSEMRQHMENLLNFSPVVLYQAIGDVRKGFVYVSPNVADILGCSAEQLLADPMFFFNQVHPEDQPVVTADWEDDHLEYRFWSQSQQTYLWLKDIRRSGQTDAHSCYGAITNISARKLAELEHQRLSRELSRQQKQLSETLQAMTDGVITINAQGDILNFNSAVCDLFGYTAAALQGASVELLMPAADAAQHQSYLQHFLQTGEKKIIGKGRRVLARHQSGREFPILLSVAELPLDEEQQRFFVGCVHDLTQSEQQQEQLVQVSKLSAIGTLTSGIAHDFNNILGIVRGYAELLSMQPDEKVVKTANNLIKAADRGSALTKSLLDFSSNRSRQTHHVELGQLLRELAPMLKEACGSSSGVRLVLQPAQEPLWVNIEKGGLEDVLLNMVINAVHASTPSGEITVSYCQKEVVDSVHFVEPISAGQYACLIIRDTGRGMSEQVLQKIFEPFFTTKGAQGTGLGLAQVFGFIRRSQGGIVVESTEGVGTRFELYLPVVKQVSQSLPVVETESLRGVAKGQTQTDEAAQILLVDDDAELLDVHATILEAAGYRVCSCNSAKAALEQLAKHRFSLLVSDIVMPEMNGFELCRAAEQQQPDLAMLLVSAYADENLIQDEANKVRYQQRLEKPVRASMLIKRVRELLSAAP